MSESIEAGADGALPTTGASAGALLRAAREAQGLGIDALAAQLKVAPRKLEALEADRYDELQGATFVRALAQAACRALKQDPTPVLLRLPKFSAHNLGQAGAGLNAPFREHGVLRDGGDNLLAQRWFLALIALLILVALGLWWLPGSVSWRFWASQEPASAGSSAAVGAPLGAVEPPPELASAPELPDPVAQASAPVQPAALGASAASASGVSRVLPNAPASAIAVVPLPSQPASKPAVVQPVRNEQVQAAQSVQLRTRADSWVEAVDAAGKTVLARMIPAGESIFLSGSLPMKVKIGNAGGTELSLRGQPVDLTPWTRDNVARVELK